MQYISTVLLLIIYAIEPIVWMKAMSILPHKYSNSNEYILAQIGYYAFTVMKQFVFFSNESTLLNNILSASMAFYIFFATIVLFEGVFREKLMTIVIFCCLTVITELPFMVIVTYLFHISMDRIGSLGIVNCICTLCSKLLLIAVCWAFYFGKSTRYMLKLYENPEILPLTLVNIVFEFVIGFIYREGELYRNKAVIMLFFFTQILLFFNAVNIIYLLVLKNKKLSKVEEELSKRKEISELTTELRQLKHDISCHASVIRDLTHKQCYNELEEYLESSFIQFDKVDSIFTLSDSALSSVLSSIAVSSKEKEIDFNCMIAVDDFYIKSYDLCAIVSNMLKNAMEANERVEREKRFIDFEISYVEGGYHINCMNSYNGNFNCFQTSKLDKENHGLGLGIIKHMTEKNRGVMQLIPHEKCFEINCFIPEARE